MKKGQIATAAIIGITVTLILTVIFTSIIATRIDEQTRTISVADDTFTGVNGTCVRVTNDCILSTTDIVNASDGVATTGNYSECNFGGDVDTNGYVLNINGADPVLNNAQVNATYTEVSCSYLSGTTGTVINYLPLLAAVAIVAFLGFYIAKR